MVVAAPPRKQLSSRQAMKIAQGFVADYLTDLMGTGAPWRMKSPLGGVWIVPIWIAYPGRAMPETIGSVAIDEATGNIVSWTPIEEITSNAERFHAQNREAIRAGFEALVADASAA